MHHHHPTIIECRHYFSNAAIVLIIAAFSQVQHAVCLGRPSANASPEGRYVVPLHRHRVPVRNDDTNVVSFKSTYFGRVLVGSPDPQAFDVVFDTGSGHLVLPDSDCASTACQTHRRYSRQASLFAMDIDHDGTPVPPGAPRDQITVAFGTGEIVGRFVNDLVCVGLPEQSRKHDKREADEQGKIDIGSIFPLQPQNKISQPISTTPSFSSGLDMGQVLLQKNSAVFKSALDDEDSDENDLNVTVQNCVNLRVVTAVEMSDEPFIDFTFDGVLGLGLDGLSLTPEFSVFGMLASRIPLAQASFGVFLADGDEERSELSLGGHSPELIWDEPTFTPVVTPDLGYWQVQIKELRIGNKSHDFCADGQCRAVVDTGTSLLAVPKVLAEELQLELETGLVDPPRDTATVLGEGVDCRKARGPSVHFDIDGFTVTLDPGDYSRQAVQFQEDGEQGPTLVPVEASLNEPGSLAKKCWPTVMPIDFVEPMGPKLFIWGEPVLRKYYTVYNWQDKSVGFGLAKHGRDQADQRLSTPLAAAQHRRPLLDNT